MFRILRLTKPTLLLFAIYFTLSLRASGEEIASVLIPFQPECSFGSGVEEGVLVLTQNLEGRSCRFKATLGVDITLIALDGGFGNPVDGHINTGIGGGPPAYIQATTTIDLPLVIKQKLNLNITGSRTFRSNIDNDDPQTFVQSIMKRYSGLTQSFDGGMLSSRSSSIPLAVQCTDIQNVSASSNINFPDAWGHNIFYRAVKVVLDCD